MARFLIRRLLLALPVLLLVTSVTYLIMSVSAGGYLPGLDLGSTMRAEDIARLRASLGLDRPLHEQYLSWLRGIASGDFGSSMLDGTSVGSHIAERLPNTLTLSLCGIALAVIIAIPTGVASAVRRGRRLDHVLSTIAVAGYAIPQFWLGLVLIFLFAISFRNWGLPSLPSGGIYDPVRGGDALDRARHLVLPAVTLSFVYLSIWSRYVRSSVLGVLSQDFVRTARAKGLDERRVLFVHALRNALLPLITLIGLELPRLVSGALVVEVVYAWPGVGRFAYERALVFDYPAVMGVTTFVAIMVVLGSLVADVAYSGADPRIRGSLS